MAFNAPIWPSASLPGSIILKSTIKYYMVTVGLSNKIYLLSICFIAVNGKVNGILNYCGIALIVNAPVKKILKPGIGASKRSGWGSQL
jgi:hypothetical protein